MHSVISTQLSPLQYEVLLCEKCERQKIDAPPRHDQRSWFQWRDKVSEHGWCQWRDNVSEQARKGFCVCDVTEGRKDKNPR